MNRRDFLTGMAGALALTILSRPHPGIAAGAVHKVRIADFEYQPARIVIRAGDRVEWHNQDFVPHTATGSEGNWDTENLEPDQRASISFPTSGEFAYFCAHHPTMVAIVVVK